MHCTFVAGRGLPVCLFLSLLLPEILPAADWPSDRHDAGRTSASPQELASQLVLHWERPLPAQKPAWPDQPSMQFDAAPIPVVMGKTLFVGSARNDSVTALDTRTGTRRWTYVTDGPVRFAPACQDGKVYFVSDDGHLYCVEANSGKLLWRFRGGPTDRKVLGNERLISTWPARGGPVLAEGTVYFTAGIWPFMGIFVHALDARTGKVLWTNDGDGSMYIAQPHQADSFAGVAPQGALVVVGNYLLLPGGRSVPACYDRATGKLLHYRLADHGKTGGGSEVAALGNLFFNGGEAFDLASGDHLGRAGKAVVLTADLLYACSSLGVRGYDWPDQNPSTEKVDRKGHPSRQASWELTKRSAVSILGANTLIKAGSRLYVGAKGRICCLELPLREITSEVSVEGEVFQLCAADDRLFAVTREGHLCCFGAEGARNAKPAIAPKPSPELRGRGEQESIWAGKVRRILDTTGVREGYCIAWGIGSGQLINELVRQTQLHVIAIDPKVGKVKSFRQELMAAGLYGERVAVHVGTPETIALPPYVASLMVAEEPLTLRSTFLERVAAALRPYGGAACFPVDNGTGDVRSSLLVSRPAPLPGWKLLSREGALPGSADWTHEHADAANTRVSKDRIVKAPLGVLWWGGPSHDGILPRHGHGPQPQVIEGRVIIEGIDMIRALDLYTGRLLWQTELPGVGQAFASTAHQPGANASGSNFVSTSDGIYVARENACVRLHPATGKPLGEFRMPGSSSEAEPGRWGYLNVQGDYLIGGANVLEGGATARKEAVSSSKLLFVLHRRSGKLLWKTSAHSGFRHNAICIGGGRLYAVDRPSADHLARLRRRGESLATTPRLVAFDLATGKELWHSEQEVFGTWLSYSGRHDVLIEAGLVSRDTLSDEPGGMRAWQGRRGTVLWHRRDHTGPAMIHGEYILEDRGACDPMTGAVRMRPDPLTGQPTEWTWARGYGCNTPAASEHLLTFRSGAAGYFDLCNDGGTGNFGGFRSSCTNNLIVAGGVLVAPDYTRTCTCSYQNQTSLALVPMPEAEMWTFQGSRRTSGPIRRVGINLGAPGDRKSLEGTLWLEYPSVGGPSPTVQVRHEPEDVTWFRRHSSRIEGTGLPWVAASGARGLTSLTVTLDRQTVRKRSFTVRLHFVEPDAVRPGKRLFDVELQGQRVLKRLDIVREAGGTNRTLVKEYRGIRIAGELRVSLSPSLGASIAEPVLCGVEIVAE